MLIVLRLLSILIKSASCHKLSEQTLSTLPALSQCQLMLLYLNEHSKPAGSTNMGLSSASISHLAPLVMLGQRTLSAEQSSRRKELWHCPGATIICFEICGFLFGLLLLLFLKEDLNNLFSTEILFITIQTLH